MSIVIQKPPSYQRAKNKILLSNNKFIKGSKFWVKTILKGPDAGVAWAKILGAISTRSRWEGRSPLELSWNILNYNKFKYGNLFQEIKYLTCTLLDAMRMTDYDP